MATSTSLMAVPISSSSRQVPLSLTDTVRTAREMTLAPVAEHHSTQAVMPAKCVPLKLSLNSCSMWPRHRTAAFSLSLWLHVDGEMELTRASDSLASESTTDLGFSPTGTLIALHTCLYQYVMLQFAQL